MTDYAEQIWDMADDLRGSTSAYNYKDYILGFIVYRYLSMKQSEVLSDFLGESNKNNGKSEEQLQIDINNKYLQIGNVESCIEMLLDDIGYAIRPEDTWVSMISKAKNKNLTLEDLQDIFSHFNENLDKSINNKTYKYYSRLFNKIDLSFTGSSAISMANALSKVALKIDSIDIYGKNDVLGNIYEGLIAKFAAGNSAGEFYTPHMVSKLLANLTTINIKKQRNLDIMDFAMGSGGLLLTYMDAVPGGHLKGTIHFYGEEINTDTYKLALMNLMMHNVAFENITLKNGDTLYEDWPINKKMDVISANPPYSNEWDITADREQDPRFKNYAIAPKSYSEYAFLLHGLYHLKNSGTMGIVMPHGVLFRGNREGKIRQKLVEKNMIDAVIGLPKKLFYNTDMQTCIIILKKNKNNNNIMFIDASNEFEKIKRRNYLTDDIIGKIVRTYEKREDIDKYAHVASYDEIEENDFNLNIPRYVDTFEPEPDIDLNEVETKLSDIDKEIQLAQKEFNEMKDNLVETDVNDDV